MKRQIASEIGPMPSLAQPLNTGSIDTATLDLLTSWRAQDATDSPEELRAAEEELADFKRAMNESRTRVGEPLLYP